MGEGAIVHTFEARFASLLRQPTSLAYPCPTSETPPPPLSSWRTRRHWAVLRMVGAKVSFLSTSHDYKLLVALIVPQC